MAGSAWYAHNIRINDIIMIIDKEETIITIIRLIMLIIKIMVRYMIPNFYGVLETIQNL